MKNKKLIEQLQKTQVSKNSIELLNKIIRNEYDKTQSERRAFDLLQLAHHYELDCFEGMIEDFSAAEFKEL